jgi:hypothetical protein
MLVGVVKVALGSMSGRCGIAPLQKGSPPQWPAQRIAHLNLELLNFINLLATLP